jgi:hypothetical protein
VSRPKDFVDHFWVVDRPLQIQQTLLNSIKVVFCLLNEIAHDSLLLFRLHRYVPFLNRVISGKTLNWV